jgi:hypothetical protein
VHHARVEAELARLGGTVAHESDTLDVNRRGSQSATRAALALERIRLRVMGIGGVLVSTGAW